MTSEAMQNDPPLQVALATSKPLPSSNIEACRELLEVERLAPSHKRRISVDDHLRWQGTHEPPHADDADITDLLHEIRNPLPVNIKPSRIKR